MFRSREFSRCFLIGEWKLTLGLDHDLLEAGVLELGALDHLVGHGHVLGVVLVVVELEGALGDVGLQGSVRVCGTIGGQQLANKRTISFDPEQ